MRIATVVEGHAEVETIPILVRRIAAEVAPSVMISTPPPIRIHRNRIFWRDELSRALSLGKEKGGEGGKLLFVLDADGDCPREKCSWILDEARQVIPGYFVSAVMAKQELEAWFLAGAESLAGKRGLPAGLSAPISPEDIRGAKEWISRMMVSGRNYQSTLDQPALATALDIACARNHSPSLSKLYRDLERMLA